MQRKLVVSLAEVLEQSGEFASVSSRPNARVPIVALEDAPSSSGLKSDICLSNRLALINSRLIRAYMLLDPRAPQLAKLVKSWAKARSHPSHDLGDF